MRGDLVLVEETNKRFGRKAGQSGFSILEMLLASAILLVGIISVVQLVPASLRLNASNRFDTMATVMAQRELDQMLSQPLSTNAFLDKDNNVISLGGAGTPGASVLMNGQTPMIDFSPGAGTPPAGFYLDQTDQSGATFELRWAVIAQVSGGKTISKRIIIGCRQTNAMQPMMPVTLDSWVQK
jgi:hypothetical protein